jgi:hypothetical protein
MYLTWLHSNELPLMESSDESAEIGEVVSMVSLLRTCVEHLVSELLAASSSTLGATGARVEVVDAAVGAVGAKDADKVVVGAVCLVTSAVVSPSALMCCVVATMAAGEVVGMDISTPASWPGQSVERLVGLLVVVSLNVMVVAAADEIVGAAVVVVGEAVGASAAKGGSSLMTWAARVPLRDLSR